MAYETQNFQDGNVLRAEELNHMEAGIVDLEKEVTDIKALLVDGDEEEY